VILNLSVWKRAKIRVAQEIQVSVASGRFNSKQLREDTNSSSIVCYRIIPVDAGYRETISEQQKLDFISKCSYKLASQYNTTELPSLAERADLRRWSISKLTEDIPS